MPQHEAKKSTTARWPFPPYRVPGEIQAVSEISLGNEEEPSFSRLRGALPGGPGWEERGWERGWVGGWEVAWEEGARSMAGEEHGSGAEQRSATASPSAGESPCAAASAITRTWPWATSKYLAAEVAAGR